ncbi:MAG TPA: hypothetical protein VER79_11340 [Candidatus Limnocylindrales bacterium]|nr:hypothetical protein [Candidatus Limnocylindrales bacterium]
MRQGLRALFAFALPVDGPRAAEILSPPQTILFNSMSRSEQLHSLAVLASVGARDSHVLAVAVLLHDAGKSRFPLHLWQRTLSVLVGALAPATAERLRHGDPDDPWARGFVVRAEHPAWGAAMAGSAGAPDDAVWLIAHHADDAAPWHSHRLYPLLVRLQAADNAN